METKHTPGKWVLGIDGVITSTYPSKNGVICDYEDRTHYTTQVVAKIDTNLGSNTLNERQKADAKILLAAPDLLAAALQIKNEIDTDGLLQGSYEKLLAAIEKAIK